MSAENCSKNFCLNDGQCYRNSTHINHGNDSYWCVCPPCITGQRCQLKNNILWTNPPTVMKMMIAESSLNYRAIFVSCITFMVVIGLINNILALSTFLKSSSIRSSYAGVYLISYTLCSIYGMIFIEIRYSFALFASKSITKSYWYQYLCDCYIGITINAILIAVCMWCSSILAIERSLIELFFFRLLGMSRKHAMIIVLSVVIFCTSGRIATILAKQVVADPNDVGLFRCGHPVDISVLSTVEEVFVWINSGGTCFLHFLANLLTLISIVKRKVFLSSKELSWWKAFAMQLSQHRDYFIPPTVILLSQLAPILFFEVGRRHACLEPKLNIWSHTHLLASFLNYVPQTVTFFIFVLPSKVYMNEFSSRTLLGKWMKKTYLTHRRRKSAFDRAEGTMENFVIDQ